MTELLWRIDLPNVNNSVMSVYALCIVRALSDSLTKCDSFHIFVLSHFTDTKPEIQTG